MERATITVLTSVALAVSSATFVANAADDQKAVKKWQPKTQMRPGGQVMESPRPGGSVMEAPRPGGSVMEAPRPGGSVMEAPRPGGSVMEAPRPGGSVMEAPRPGVSVNELPVGSQRQIHKRLGPGQLA